MEVHKFIKNNFNVIRLLSKLSEKPDTLIRDLEIYDYYSRLNISSTMDKYTFTAEAKNVSEGKVKKVIAYMEKHI